MMMMYVCMYVRMHLPSTTVRSSVTPVSLMWTKPDVCMYVCMYVCMVVLANRWLVAADVWEVNTEAVFHCWCRVG